MTVLELIETLEGWERSGLIRKTDTIAVSVDETSASRVQEISRSEARVGMEPIVLLEVGNRFKLA
jgi:hypothetical protein